VFTRDSSEVPFMLRSSAHDDASTVLYVDASTVLYVDASAVLYVDASAVLYVDASDTSGHKMAPGYKDASLR